jgi:hypothetical protein
VKKAIDADSSIELTSDVLVPAREPHTGTLISLASIRAILDYEPFKGSISFLIIAISRKLDKAIAQPPLIQILMNSVRRPSPQQKVQFLMISKSGRSGF